MVSVCVYGGMGYLYLSGLKPSNLGGGERPGSDV